MFGILVRGILSKYWGRTKVSTGVQMHEGVGLRCTSNVCWSQQNQNNNGQGENTRKLKALLWTRLTSWKEVSDFDVISLRCSCVIGRTVCITGFEAGQFSGSAICSLLLRT